MEITPDASWEEELKIISMDIMFLPAKDPDADDRECHAVQSCWLQNPGEQGKGEHSPVRWD